MIKLPPFFKRKESFEVDISLDKIRQEGRYGKKIIHYISIPTFSFDNVWKGSSEIIKKFYFTVDKNFSILKLPTPSGNFCPCIAWKSGNSIVRYKLWENIGELLYVPLYNGKIINKNFYIEIWTTNSTPIVNDVKNIIYISQFTIPINLCDDTAIEDGLNPNLCNDMIFNDIAEFNPSIGEFYEVVNTCLDTELRNLIAPPVALGIIRSYLKDNINVLNVGIYSNYLPYIFQNIDDIYYESQDTINTRAIGILNSIVYKAEVHLIGLTDPFTRFNIKASWGKNELIYFPSGGIQELINLSAATRTMLLNGFSQILTFDTETNLYKFEANVDVPNNATTIVNWGLNLNLVGFEGSSLK